MQLICNVVIAVVLSPQTLILQTEIVEAGIFTREVTITDIYTHGYNYEYLQVQYILLQH